MTFETFFSIIAFPVAIYLMANVLYLCLSAVAGWFGDSDDVPVQKQPAVFRKIVVLIPAYKEDKVILDSVAANLKQQYPADRFDLLVIADSFRAETIQALSKEPVRVLEVSFEQSTVQKSLNAALASLGENEYDIVVISDADNHMAPDFLHRINLAFDGGWRAVQGHRVAKNTNTSVAIFDAMNEEVSNHIYRMGQRALGLSAQLIGSGMAFEPAAMKRGMSQLKTMGGYDKELEISLLAEGIHIGYLDDAYIYDEKVQNLEVFERQRTRWIAAQVHFVKTYFSLGMRELFKGNYHAANAVLKFLIIPRTLLLALLFTSCLLGILTGFKPLWSWTGWMLGVLAFAMVISIPGYLWKQLSVRDLTTFPKLVFRMIRSLLKVKTAGKSFLHTPHGETKPDATGH
nr:glycosyltransferase family 2 protein [uncultured Arsenicibacter sp.]